MPAARRIRRAARHTFPELLEARFGTGVRTVVAVVTTIALGLYFPTILDLQMYSYTIYGAAITPAVLAVLFWKRATTAGAVAALITGSAVTTCWPW